MVVPIITLINEIIEEIAIDGNQQAAFSLTDQIFLNRIAEHLGKCSIINP